MSATPPMKINTLLMMMVSAESLLPAASGEIASLPDLPVAKVNSEQGRVELKVNGRSVSRLLYKTDALRCSLDVLPRVAAAGFEVAAVPFYANDEHGASVGPIWVGERKYDWQPFDQRLELIRALAPGLKIILDVGLLPPGSWIAAHPGERNKWEKEDGNALPKLPAQLSHNGGFYAPSLASKVYRADLEHYLREMIAHIHTMTYRDCVIGIHLMGGRDAQWFHQGWWETSPGVLTYGDYSEPMRGYFSEFLRGKYGNDARAFEKAWGRALSFDKVVIPSVARREGNDFRDPAKDQEVIDFTEAYGQAPADLVRHLAHVVKHASGGRMIVTVYSGASIMDADNCSQWAGRFLREQWLRCPDIDGIVAVTYNQRPLGEPGAFGFVDGSYRLHGKLALHEQDIRTYLEPDAIQHEPVWGATANWDQQRQMLIRELGRVIAGGSATWMYDMYGRWYDAPEFWKLFAQFQKISAAVDRRGYKSVADLAVVVDDPSMIYRPFTDHLLMYNSVTMQKTTLGWIGAPYDTYLLEDLFDPATPRYKCYFFLNTYRVDSATRGRLHELLRAARATALWLHAPGIICDNRLATENIALLTGFKVRRHEGLAPLVRLDGDSPIVGGLRGRHYGTPEEAGVWRDFKALYGKTRESPAYDAGVHYCPEADPGVKILGTMKGSAVTGLALREMAGWTSIYSSGLTFTPELLRNVLRSAGGFLYVDDAATNVCAHRDFIAVYPRTPGARKLALPRKAVLSDCLSGEQLGPGREFTLRLEANEARIFAISPED